MNLKEHDYHTLDLPNIKVEVHKGVTEEQSKGLRFEHKIGLLAARIAKARPSWTVVLPGGWYASTKHTSSKLTVYQNKEELGKVCLSTTREKEPYVITNTRIDAKRKRGKGQITGNLNKAVKIVLGNFHPKTVMEQVEDMIKSTNNMLNTAQAQKNNELRQAQNVLAAAFTTSLVHNFDAAKEYIKDRVSGSNIDVLKNYPETASSYRHIDRMYREYSGKKDKGFFLILSGTEYNVYNRSLGKLDVYTTDDLPSWMKRSLGLLKLLEEAQVLEEVGVKVDDFNYYLVDNALKDKSEDA